MVDIGSIRSWQPGAGPVTTWTASPASREAMARAGHDPVAPSFQQAQHLRTAQFAKDLGREVPRLIMASWKVDGVCNVAAMTQTINLHIRRHDTYHSAFDVQEDGIARRTIDDPERLEFVPTPLGFMTADEIRACPERHRSPLLLRSLEDYLAGQRYPLSLVHTDASVLQAPDLRTVRAA